MHTFRRPWPIAWASILTVVGSALAPVAAQTASRFDGAWRVDLTCTETAAGVKGYAWHFAARVANGMFHGERGQAGAPGSMTLDGLIGADGAALLIADGLTDDPRGTFRHVPTGSAFHYSVKAQFGLANGAGTRVEQRPCTLVFNKQ